MPPESFSLCVNLFPNLSSERAADLPTLPPIDACITWQPLFKTQPGNPAIHQHYEHLLHTAIHLSDYLSRVLPVALKGLGVGIGGNYNDKAYIVQSRQSGEFYMPAYTVLNATLSYDQPVYRVTLS